MARRPLSDEELIDRYGPHLNEAPPGGWDADLEVDVVEIAADEMPAVLRNGTAELALTYDFGHSGGLDTETLAVAAPYVALAADHRLAGRRSIRLAGCIRSATQFAASGT